MRRTDRFPLDYTLRMKSLKKSTVRADGFYRNAFCQRRSELLNEHIQDYYFKAGYYETIDALNWAAGDLENRAPDLWEIHQQTTYAAETGDWESIDARVIPTGLSVEELLEWLKN